MMHIEEPCMLDFQYVPIWEQFPAHIATIEVVTAFIQFNAFLLEILIKRLTTATLCTHKRNGSPHPWKKLCYCSHWLTWVWHNLCQKIWQQISDLIPTVFLLNVFWILKFKWIFLITICRVSGSIRPKGLTKWRHICKTNHSCKTAFSHENLFSLPPRPNWMWGRKRLDSHHYIHYKCSLNIFPFFFPQCVAC